MADLPNARYCIDPNKTLPVNFNGNSVNINDVWSLNENKGYKYCVEITSTVDAVSSTLSANTEYTSCLTCLQENYGYIVLSDCNGQYKFAVFLNELDYLPNVGDTVYASLFYRFNGSVYEGCFKIDQIGQFNLNTYNKLIEINDYANLNPGTIFTAQTDCKDCITNTSLTYLVKRCPDGESFYLQLPTNLTGNLISFVYEGEEFCGDVIETSSNGFDSSFVFDFGNKVKCEVCLTGVGETILIQNCLNSSDEVVVWGSSLYELGESSNLSKGTGCYKVIGPTESGVTESFYFDYDPQPDCNTCSSCNGMYYTFSGCNELAPSIDYFASNQILEVGEIFYHPVLQTCCVITTISDVILSSLPFFSTVLTYGVNGCSLCQSSTSESNVYYYDFTFCGLTGQTTGFIMTFEELFINDVVKIKNGSNDFLCVTISNSAATTPDSTSIFDVVKDNSDNIIKYNDCIDCLGQTLIGVAAINCNTGLKKYVSLNQLDWIVATGLSILPLGSVQFDLPVMRLNTQECYVIDSPCVIPLTATTEYFEPLEFYAICQLCPEFTPPPPRSANTETIICEQVCISGGSGGYTVVQVVPPHPVWTDGYGTPVTQMNAVTLGGMFGLNS